MDVSLHLLPLLAPLSLLAAAGVALRSPGAFPTAVLSAVRISTAVAFVVALASAAVVAVAGPATSVTLGWNGAGFAIRLDALSAAMLVLVAFMGGVVLHYSRTYLDGDPRHGAFMGWIATTVASVMLLVLSGNLVQLVVMWAATSAALHRLLLFYPERRGAVVAARKKFFVARAGDLTLAAAALLLAREFRTTDLALLLERAHAAAGEPVSGAVVAAAILLALSAALKTAMFPTHGWLAEVMETPTPVSALLHAGILNGGIFLLARLADVVLLAPAALGLLIVIGGFTALFASVVMATQSSIKVALAYSSAAHMGFMILLCGFGAYPAAILHLIAHSFYKAHAFLSSGSAVEELAGRGSSEAPAPGAGTIMGGMVMAAATVAGLAWALGVNVATEPVSLALAVMLAIALTQLWGRGLQGESNGGGLPAGVLLRVAIAAAGTGLAFFGLESGASALLGGAVPEAPEAGPVRLALMAGVVLAFAGAVLTQLRLPALAHTPRFAGLYVHIRNGLYANAWFDRLVGALSVQPRQGTPLPNQPRTV